MPADYEFKRLDARDVALVIASEYRGREHEFRARIVQALETDKYPLVQALLASLRVTQALTTNYDTLYEAAFDPGDPDEHQLRVLPRGPYEPGKPWLMKLHGDSVVPESIVLSRDDYMRFDSQSIPMASVLQSAMLTRHILFVGYSVSDDNIVRLARQVVHFRESHGMTSGGADGDPVGTVLALRFDPLKQRLWQGVLRYVDLTSPTAPQSTAGQEEAPMGVSALTEVDDVAAARNVEIFLDLLGMHACRDAPYFLVDRYQGLLPEADRPLAEALHHLQVTVAGAQAGSAAAARVRALLVELGGDGPGLG